MKIHVPREIIRKQNLPYNLQISQGTSRRANSAAKDTQIIQPSFSTPFSTTGSTNTAVLHHHLSARQTPNCTTKTHRQPHEECLKEARPPTPRPTERKKPIVVAGKKKKEKKEGEIRNGEKDRGRRDEKRKTEEKNFHRRCRSNSRV